MGYILIPEFVPLGVSRSRAMILFPRLFPWCIHVPELWLRSFQAPLSLSMADLPRAFFHGCDSLFTLQLFSFALILIVGWVYVNVS